MKQKKRDIVDFTSFLLLVPNETWLKYVRTIPRTKTIQHDLNDLILKAIADKAIADRIMNTAIDMATDIHNDLSVSSAHSGRRS